jgi:glutathione S-transferase
MMPRVLASLNEILANKTFLVDEALSVADIAVASTLGYAMMIVKIDYSDYPAVMSYVQRLSDRHAFQKTMMPQ